ncbi:integral membrane protein, YccS/YhfK family [Mycolicibacterium aurum]|uniref:Integral membrane protein, YccS/YhfK family n=1 Tax=Mycolicibacterium aurum TaxID=1791 RepID=A0A448INZ8_MYCAU|nr:FUSC family protein [Mycolicibacterium aurum]VEG54141.1 integral membrane protein, YccS/YhfK family [Mycolicibacterium aurum]
MPIPDRRPTSAVRWRAIELLRPVGASRWGMAVWLAGGLGAILGVSTALGHAEWGSAVGLGLVLTAVPSLPVAWRPAMATIVIRGLSVLAGATLAVLTAGHPPALAAATVVAAVGGGLLPRVGPTAGLAVVLIAIDLPGDGSAGALLPYMVGVLVVALAWACWFLCAVAMRRHRGDVVASEPQTGPNSRTWTALWPHAVRVGIAVAAAVGLAGLLPDDLVGGHWLVTSVILTVQPDASDTGIRLAQRLSGNTVGAVIAALVLGAHPSVPVVAVVAVVLFTLAMALRPVNYTWWAVTGPPVLLVISEYPDLFPWYEGGVRLAMNLVGAVIVLVVVFGAPALTRFGSRVGGTASPRKDDRIVYTKSNQGGDR